MKGQYRLVNITTKEKNRAVSNTVEVLIRIVLMVVITLMILIVTNTVTMKKTTMTVIMLVLCSISRDLHHETANNELQV